MMKREYFGMLVMLVIVVIILLSGYLFEQFIVKDILNRYIIIWFVLVFYLGQYSMRFPKQF